MSRDPCGPIFIRDDLLSRRDDGRKIDGNTHHVKHIPPDRVRLHVELEQDYGFAEIDMSRECFARLRAVILAFDECPSIDADPPKTT